MFGTVGLVLAAGVATEFAHNVFAEHDEQNNQGAKIQTEEAAFQDNHQQNNHPQDVTTGAAFFGFRGFIAIAVTMVAHAHAF